jgi:hypothetical protein
MPHRLSEPFPLLESADDDNESPSDSSHSTPRSSFFLYLDPSDSQHGDDLCLRPRSLVSFDSGYFSIMGKESPTSKSFRRKSSGTDLRVPINNATDATQESPGREGVIRSLLRKKKKSMTSPSPPDLDLFANGLSEDDPVPRIQWAPFSLPSPRSKPCDPSVEAFEQQDRFVVRRGMRHHPYSRDDAPYMLAYDRTLLDKYGISHNRSLLF